jgi:hypothetical protein
MDRKRTVKKTFAAFGLLAGCVSAGSAYAIGATGEMGTTGIGAHASIPLRPDLHLRVGAGYFRYSYSGSTTFLNYDLKLKSNTYDALLDWFPVEKSGFRLTVGLTYNGNKVDSHARPSVSGSYLIGGNVYSVDSIGTVEGTTGFRRIAPYIGIGWGRPAGKDKGWSFSTDLGVLFQGEPHTTLTSSGCTIFVLVCDLLTADLPRESAALNDEVRKYRTYPVLRIGVSYSF